MAEEQSPFLIVYDVQGTKHNEIIYLHRVGGKAIRLLERSWAKKLNRGSFGDDVRYTELDVTIVNVVKLDRQGSL